MVLLTFDEEESPIRHYYKQHFINRKRVISCQIDLLAFVKVRNYDGSRIHHVKGSHENSIGTYFAACNVRVIYDEEGRVYVGQFEQSQTKEENLRKEATITGYVALLNF